MLMDVVDTVRHAQEDARRVAGAMADEETLIQQVLRVYESQGMEVDEATVREGLALMKERRFEFIPPRPSLSTRLAGLYITRKQWGIKAGWTVIVLGLAIVLGSLGTMLYQKHQEMTWASQALSSLDDERRLRHQLETLTDRAEELQSDGSHPKAKEAAGAALGTLRSLGELLDALPPIPEGEQAQASLYEQDKGTAQARTQARRSGLQKAFATLSVAIDEVSDASSLHDLGLLAGTFYTQAPADLSALQSSYRLRFEEAMRAGDAGQARGAVDVWGEAMDLDGLHQVLLGQGRALGGDSQQVVEGMLQDSRDALVAGNLSTALSLLEGAQTALETLPVSYQLRIVNETGAQTGIWRYYDNDRSRRSYFIVVDAVDAAGHPIQIPVRDVEVGQVTRVSRFAIRVPEAVYNAIGEDKTDDGIVDQPIFGTKKAGEMEPSYEYETLGGAITAW